ncbi:MAG TPA: nucleotide sugar dehydrogenase [Stellaceae bacterium]|nr:nucleotide sugar dehydrogenase [Stellaceae bacterium]
MTATDRVSVVGLGKLGLSLAASLALRGFDVLGIDADQHVIEMVQAGIAPVGEPGLSEALRVTVGESLRITSSTEAAVEHGDVTFVLVPSPGREDGRLCSEPLVNALQSLSRALAIKRSERHVLVIGTTTQPGTIDREIVPLVERTLGVPVGDAVDVSYNPELVALGATLDGFQRPDFVLIGESHASAGDEVERIQRKLTRNNPPIHRMSIISAEIAKLALNAYLALKISYANLLSQISAQLPGAEIDKITAAIGADRRVGDKYLRAGKGYGGPCLPRDTLAFRRFSEGLGSAGELLSAVERINEGQTILLTEAVLDCVARAPARRVGILGLSFKEGTPIVVGSIGAELVKRLVKADVRVIGHDALVPASVGIELGAAIEFANHAATCVASAPVVVLLNRDPSYMDAVLNYRGAEPRSVVDCWGMLGGLPVPEAVHVIRIGAHPRADGRPYF